MLVLTNITNFVVKDETVLADIKITKKDIETAHNQLYHSETENEIRNIVTHIICKILRPLSDQKHQVWNQIYDGSVKGAQSVATSSTKLKSYFCKPGNIRNNFNVPRSPEKKTYLKKTANSATWSICNTFGNIPTFFCQFLKHIFAQQLVVFLFGAIVGAFAYRHWMYVENLQQQYEANNQQLALYKEFSSYAAPTQIDSALTNSLSNNQLLPPKHVCNIEIMLQHKTAGYQEALVDISQKSYDDVQEIIAKKKIYLTKFDDAIAGVTNMIKTTEKLKLRSEEVYTHYKKDQKLFTQEEVDIQKELSWKEGQSALYFNVLLFVSVAFFIYVSATRLFNGKSGTGSVRNSGRNALRTP